MTDHRASPAAGARVEEAAVEKFRAGLRGQVLRTGDHAYDEARKVWNGMFDRRPALIARCAGIADVMSAVSFARAHGLPAAVRGGGHSFPGHSVCDGGLVIDLSQMKGVRVDLAARTARAQSGVKWIDFDHETQAAYRHISLWAQDVRDMAGWETPDRILDRTAGGRGRARAGRPPRARAPGCCQLVEERRRQAG